MNLPNQLSIFRIVLVPIIILLLEIPGEFTRFLALIIFILASFTDFLDGHIARRYDMITKLGQLIDPLADKILTLAVFVQLTALGEVPAWVVILILSRELTISIFRAIAASEGVVIAAGWTGKLKTIFQMLAILMLLSNNYIGKILDLPLDMIFVYISAALAFISAFEYIYVNRGVLVEKKQTTSNLENERLEENKIHKSEDVQADVAVQNELIAEDSIEMQDFDANAVNKEESSGLEEEEKLSQSDKKESDSGILS